MRYGVRLPKYILLHSRKFIAQEFKKLHPQCEYPISTITREFPQNAVTATTRDLERNTCPIHANAQRVVKALNKCLSKIKCDDDRLPVSCRDLVYKTMCQTELVVSSNPLTWRTWSSTCVVGECDNCKKKLI